jgi:hypothetical protein
VTAFLMEVDRADDQWDESDARQRLWCGPEEALAKIDNGAHRRLLEEAIARLSP